MKQKVLKKCGVYRQIGNNKKPQTAHNRRLVDSEGRHLRILWSVCGES